MKSVLSIIVALLLSGMLSAQEIHPFNIYMENPQAESFGDAVESLLADYDDAEKGVNTRAYMLLLLHRESERLIDELLAMEDSLAAGQRFTIANILLEVEKLDQATALYEGLNRDYPQWSCPWRHKGEAYYKMGEYEEAVMALQEAINTNEEHYDAYVWMAFALNELGFYEEALQHLERALELNPEEEADSQDEAIPTERIQALLQELRGRMGQE